MDGRSEHKRTIHALALCCITNNSSLELQLISHWDIINTPDFPIPTKIIPYYYTCTKQTASKQNNTHKMVHYRDNQSDSSYNGGYSNDVEPDKKLNASLWNNNFGNKHHYSNNNNHNNSGCISINIGRKLLLLILELLVISCLLLFVLALRNLILILPSNSIWLAN